LSPKPSPPGPQEPKDLTAFSRLRERTDPAPNILANFWGTEWHDDRISIVQRSCNALNRILTRFTLQAPSRPGDTPEKLVTE
jgi:hypothetical protein